MPWSENNKQLHQQSVKDSHVTHAVTMTTRRRRKFTQRDRKNGTVGLGQGQAFLALPTLLCFLWDQEAGLPLALQVLVIF